MFRFQPCDTDRIPVIFVHGTLSSPVWWAEILKTGKANKRMIREKMVITPVPSVKRLIFLSTPHRESYLSSSFSRNLVHRLIKLPVILVTGLNGINGFLSDNVKSQWQGKVPTSVDAMSPEDPLLKTIADTPFAPTCEGIQSSP